MLRKNKFFKLASMLVVACLLMSIIPEIRILGLFIEAVGLETLILIISGHLAVTLKWLYSKSFGPILSFTNLKFEKMDPYYFIAKRQDIIECPQLLLHAMPYLVAVLFFLSCNGWLYA